MHSTHRHRFSPHRWLILPFIMTAVLCTATNMADAQPKQPSPETDIPVRQAPPTATTNVPTDQRAAVLGADWARSADLAWTTFGDANGFHVLVAKAADGYLWHTAATLSETGFDTDQWIGNACVTASGR